MNMQVGYRYKMIGQADTMAKAFSEIAKAVILAIIMIYMVLAAEFESFMRLFGNYDVTAVCDYRCCFRFDGSRADCKYDVVLIGKSC